MKIILLFKKKSFRKLENNLKKTVDEIAAVETMIRNLKDAIWDKDAPNKVTPRNFKFLGIENLNLRKCVVSSDMASDTAS